MMILAAIPAARNLEPDRKSPAAGGPAGHPALHRAAALLHARKPAEAEAILSEFLHRSPDHPPALRLLANAAEMAGRHAEAERLLLRTLEVAPDFADARYNLATFYHNHDRAELALMELDRLLAQRPDQPDYLFAKAAALTRLWRHEEAVAAFERLLKSAPAGPDVWTHFGNALRVAGREEDSVATYRRALTLSPHSGAIWRSLADVKTYRFTDEDVQAMEDALRDDALPAKERTALHYALGNALEREGRHAEAFSHYAEGSFLRRSAAPYDAAGLEDFLRRSAAAFGPGHFAATRAVPVADALPIFIVGLPRSGSTLVEQILASHSQVEATAELPLIPRLARYIGADGDGYPEAAARLTPDRKQAFRSGYLSESRTRRPLGRPFFIDKNPVNWQHVGLIHAVFPEARIIDVRRHPLACGISNYRQLYAQGHEFSYSLQGIGHYYRSYAAAMAAVSQVAPGRVYRLVYERLVDEPEQEIRRLLEHLGLGFERACLSFHESRRSVRTPSAEQVRRPINRDGLDAWQPFDPWLGPLKTELGAFLASYPDVPAEREDR